MNQLHGLGQADFIAAIIGPLATGGADAYRTYSEGQLSKDELKQREKEFAAMSKLQDQQSAAQERSLIVSRHTALQQEAIRNARWQQNLPLIIGGAILITLGLAAAFSGKRG